MAAGKLFLGDGVVDRRIGRYKVEISINNPWKRHVGSEKEMRRAGAWRNASGKTQRLAIGKRPRSRAALHGVYLV